MDLDLINLEFGEAFNQVLKVQDCIVVESLISGSSKVGLTHYVHPRS